MLDRPDEYARMAAVECRHWWYRSLHALVLRAVRRHAPGGDEAVLLDAGCGTGGLLGRLRDEGFRRAAGFDVSPEAVRIARERGLDVVRGDLRQLDGLRPAGSVGVLTALDSLYFLAPEEQAVWVEAAWRMLVPGGLLILNLPAFPAFAGRHDRCVGIPRRVTLADVPVLVPPARFELVERRCWPALLSPAVAAVRLAQRRRLRRHPDLPPRSDLALSPGPLNGLLRAVTWVELALPPGWPWASSLFLVGRKRP